MSITQEELCREVEESIADVVEGFAPARLVEHIAGCDRCRDVRYEAEKAIELVSHAGADFHPTEGFPDRMLGLTLEQRPDGPVPGSAVSGSSGAAGPVSTAAPRTSGVSPAPRASTVEAAPIGSAMTELAQPPVYAGAAAEGNATVFEPNRFAESQAPDAGEPAPEEASPPAAEQAPPAATPVLAERAPVPTLVESSARGGESFVPTQKTVPLSAVLDARKHATPIPSEAELARPVEAVTGRNNTGPAASHLQTSPSPVMPGAGPLTGRAAEAQVPDLLAPAAPKAPAGSGGAPVVSLFRRKGFIAALAGGMAAAAAFGAFLVNKGEPTTDESKEFTEGAWSGKVAVVTRASADGGGGLEVCKDTCKPAAVDAAIEPGSIVKTDSRTRARIKLADDSWIAIDRNTEIVLPAGTTRQAKVERGLVVADVKEVQGAKPAKLLLPQGEVTIMGTKVAATVTDRRSAVEVVRGWVDVTSASGTTVKVRSGEEATVEGTGDPIVASATNLSDSVAWTTEGQNPEEASALRGLGELRARKPGEQQERAKAVRLSKHSVKVRVVDVVARTEVDETFTNETDDELEGIFRFPLPPDAQIEKLALEVDGQLLEGAFVDRDRGAAIWRGVIQNAAPKAPKPREEIVWVPGPWRDPALLEWQRGGRFELRIFPIPKKGSRRVVLTYTQVVPQSGGVRRFSYPLAHDASGSTKIDDFSVDLQVLGHDPQFGVESRGYQLAKSEATAGADRFVMNEKSFVPAGDLTVEYALPDRKSELTAWAYEMPATQSAAATGKPTQDAQAPGAPQDKLSQGIKPAAGLLSAAERAKQAELEAKALSDDGSPFVALSLRPKLPRFPEGKERLHVIVVDSSRSMVGERYARARQLAAGIVREMDRRDTFLVLACDTTCQAMGGTASRSIPAPVAPSVEAAGQVESFLGSIDPEGGSNLLAAVQAARQAASGSAGKELRILYLGDGTPTVGPTKAATLESAVRHALPGGDGAVVAVALGSDADTTTLAAMARGGNGVVVPFVPGQRVAATAVDVLASAYGSVLSDVEVILPAGLAEVTPARLDPIPAGGETFVYARMKGAKEVSGNVTIRGRVGRDKFEQTYPAKFAASTNVGNAFVPRLFAAAKIADLEKVGVTDDKARVIALSKRFQVASRHTSMIVLESEAMFKAFGLDKNGLESGFTGENRAQSSSADAEGEAQDEDGEGDLAKEESREKKAKGGGRADLDGLADSSTAQGPGTGSGFGGSRKSADPSPTGAPAAEPAPPPPSAPAKKPSTIATDDPFSPSWDANRDRRRPASRPPRNLVPMRRVFDRKATFSADNALAKEVSTALAEAETAHKASPDSRDKTVALYKALMASGRIGEAQELTAKWSERDALDPDALLARADLAAMNGDRSRAMRILSGLSDVRPGDKTVQRRLVNAFTQLSAPALACQHRLALADLSDSDVNVVAAAVRCSQDEGLSDVSRTILSNAPESLRGRIDTTSRSLKLAELPALAGDMRVTATWSQPVDLDLALVDKNGRRFSWLGSTASTIGVSAQNAASTTTETIAVSGLGNGTLALEVVRASADGVRGPITGELTITLPGGQVRKQPFTITGNRAEVGSVRVFFESRLVPVDQFGGGWRGPTTF